MAAEDVLQARRDRRLRETLDADAGIRRALRTLSDRIAGHGLLHRRRLLTRAVRLSREMAPRLWQSLQDCREILGVRDAVELYVRPEETLNASCSRPPPGYQTSMPVAIAMSSRMVEHFSEEELRFVLGHELGHLRFDHFGLPMPALCLVEDLAGRVVSRGMQIELYVWARAAEISADRAGVVCAGSPEPAASAFFKLSSGLLGTGVGAGHIVKRDLAAYARQIDSLAATPSARAEPRGEDDTLDCFQTHPFSPLRVRALLAFSRSREYRTLSGAGPGDSPDGPPIALDRVEAIIERDLDMMEPGYLEENSDEARLMRQFLYGAGILLAASDGEITDAEVDAMRTLLGAVDAEGTRDPDQAQAAVNAALPAIAKVPLARRAQLMCHLTLIAAADGNVDDRELPVLLQLAGKLGVHPRIIDDTLTGASAAMD